MCIRFLRVQLGFEVYLLHFWRVFGVTLGGGLLEFTGFAAAVYALTRSIPAWLISVHAGTFDSFGREMTVTH